MTAAELDELLADCPVLFHMAEAGSWPSIRRHGLLSTAAILDLCRIEGQARAALEAARRPAGVALEGPDGVRIVVRDNGPMDDASLRRCLTDGLQPADWYRLLNRRVFFWMNPARVERLLAARSYAARAHDVLELDARALVAAHRERITLSPINSGATRPFPVPRGPATFLPIDDYPYATWRGRRARRERVVELAVADAVPDAARFVLRVTRRGGGATPETLFESPPSPRPPL